jgi:hypothetical protein
MLVPRIPACAVLVLLVSFVVSLANAGAIKGRVDVGEIPGANLVVKCDADKQAFVRKDGTFVLRDVEPGIHEVSVSDSLRWFTRALVEVDESGKQVRVVEVLPPTQPNQGPVRREAKTLLLKPLGMIDYFEKRQQMSVMSFFANPMMLMMLFTLGMGFLMPKMMENLDPEELKQMQEQMAQQQRVAADPSKAFANLLGGGDKKEDSDEE